ncbi:MAG: hypothetical protein JWM56_582 [Candidatus Peribacteria bacterium]|nr:hypothetical protein [Candidatus Peribacteria bacterium]
MPIDPVKIPQNVYIEDHIVGPLTLRQTLMMTGGCGFSYVLYSVFAKAAGTPPDIITTIILWVPGVLSIAFSLIKINDLTLMKIVMLTLERMQKAPVRTWAPRKGISITIHTSSKKAEPAKAVTPENQTQRKIEELSSILDHGMMPLGAAPVADEAIVAVSAAAPAAPAVEKPVDTPDDSDMFPVDPSKISIDKKTPEQQYSLSDLSVFRDIFPHTK